MDARQAKEIVNEYYQVNSERTGDACFNCNHCSCSTFLWFNRLYVVSSSRHSWMKVMCPICGTVYRIDWGMHEGKPKAAGWEEINTDPKETRRD